jgi:hypothetical protein
MKTYYLIQAVWEAFSSKVTQEEIYKEWRVINLTCEFVQVMQSAQGSII